GAIDAEGKVGMMLNIKEEKLEGILKVLPALQKPTVSNLSEKGWLAINTILDENIVKSIIPKLKDAGATGIVEYPLNKIIL
ncbi:MAG: ATP phosphoribosyltransferase, partial [Candidatus Woesearchaeota archaeon]|nr:ATP phosphoribosyltransferase [Candidatus Woesearchaeota archaeon]